MTWIALDLNGKVVIGTGIYRVELGPLFPPAVGHYHQKFHAWVSESGVVCRQTDFSGWVARVTREQLLDFISYCYGPGKTDAIEQLIEFIESLDDSKEYGLVAEEF